MAVDIEKIKFVKNKHSLDPDIIGYGISKNILYNKLLLISLYLFLTLILLLLLNNSSDAYKFLNIPVYFKIIFSLILLPTLYLLFYIILSGNKIIKATKYVIYSDYMFVNISKKSISKWQKINYNSSIIYCEDDCMKNKTFHTYIKNALQNILN